MAEPFNEIPISSHPTALETQWLNAMNPEEFIRNNSNFNNLMMRYRSAIRELHTKLDVLRRKRFCRPIMNGERKTRLSPFPKITVKRPA